MDPVAALTIARTRTIADWPDSLPQAHIDTWKRVEAIASNATIAAIRRGRRRGGGSMIFEPGYGLGKIASDQWCSLSRILHQRVLHRRIAWARSDEALWYLDHPEVSVR